ncbi:MAG: polysaccharide pyruvyl transferase family protein [Pseudomonadota bacterium]
MAASKRDYEFVTFAALWGLKPSTEKAGQLAGTTGTTEQAMSIRTNIRTLSYLLKPVPYALEKPVVLQFPVIDICNSRCQMCRIWENKKSADIAPEELRQGLKNPLFSEVRSVGLNGGEPTLRADLPEIARVLFETLPKLEFISLITNGYKYKDVIARAAAVGEIAHDHGGALDLMVSLDGAGEVHDRVRGKPGNFERARHVTDFAQESPLVDVVRIGCTIIKENVAGLADLLEYCIGQDLYVKYRLGVPHKRLYTRDLKEPYALEAAERFHIAEFLEGLISHYETNPNQVHFYRSLIGQLVHGAPRRAGCDWQHRAATINSRGELMYCAVESDVLGKIQDGDAEEAYFGGKDHLRDIVENRCADCHHDYVGLPDKAEYTRQVAGKALERTGLRDVAFAGYRHSGLRTVRWQRAFNHQRDRLTALGAKARTPRAAGAPFRVTICGWYGTETLGDKAIIGGVANALTSSLGPTDVTLVSLNPYVSEITKAQMPDLMSDWKILDAERGQAALGGADLLVLGGGPIMAIHDLAVIEALFAAAQRLSIPRIIAGSGVGPLGDAYLDASITRILSMADRRIYRDAASRAAAAKLGVDTTHDAVTEDPAFAWLRAQQPTPTPQGTGRTLLLGLRDFPHAEYARHLDEVTALAARDRYEEAVISGLRTLIARHDDLTIRPLPMCTNHFGGDDRWFYRRLFRGHAELQDRMDTSLLGPECAPCDYLEAFQNADAAIAMRFHALVFALGLRVPTAAIDYTLGRGKVKALAESSGVPHQDLVELTPEFLADTATALLTGGLPAGHPPEARFHAAIAAAVDDVIPRETAGAPA